MSRVLLAGAAGQLGSAIARAFGDREVVAHTRATLDVTDPEAVQRVVADAAPSVVVNCAAFNDVDGAEDRPAEAFAVNALAVRSLARAAEDSGADARALRDGLRLRRRGARAIRRGGGAGATERLCDVEAAWANGSRSTRPRGYVLRVESLFGMPPGLAGPPRHARRPRRGHGAGPRSSGCSPIAWCRPAMSWTSRRPRGTWWTAARHRDSITASTRGTRRWHDVATEDGAAARRSRRGSSAMTTDEVRLKAPRPRFCALANRKLAAAGFRMPAWQDAVARWIATRDRPAA